MSSSSSSSSGSLNAAGAAALRQDPAPEGGIQRGCRRLRGNRHPGRAAGVPRKFPGRRGYCSNRTPRLYVHTPAGRRREQQSGPFPRPLPPFCSRSPHASRRKWRAPAPSCNANGATRAARTKLPSGLPGEGERRVRDGTGERREAEEAWKVKGDGMSTRGRRRLRQRVSSALTAKRFGRARGERAVEEAWSVQGVTTSAGGVVCRRGVV